MSDKRARYLRGSTEQCPKCGSRSVVFAADMVAEGYGPGLATCKNCRTLWEPFKPDDIWDKDDPLCSFREPCNNCAFRPGSHEQADRDRWLEIISALKDGGSFHCHKGVPIEPGAEHGFAYPTKPSEVHIDGELITTTRVADRAKLRLCRGFLNALPRLRKWREETGT